jgi:CheY-like chemotaxis protein
MIERQVGQMSRLVDDLLEVSRIGRGLIRLEQEDVDLREVVGRALDSTRPQLEQRRHELINNWPLEPIWVHGDPTRLEQVVLNLLNNAAKYTEEGGRIAVGVAQEGARAVVRIKDNGVGIPPELLPRIFELFTQAEQSLDRAQGGMGIGLTLVQKLVELHGGSVEAHSQPGEGSEFVVSLPLVAEPTRQDQSPETEPAARPGRALRVLVVDDNVDQAESMAMLLRAAGQEVRVVYSGAHALATAAEYRPQVVLLDIGLPEIDGYEIARRLRQDPLFERLPLIAMTGYGQDTDRQRSLAAGFDHHLVKPADPQRLRELLEQLGAEAD